MRGLCSTESLYFNNIESDPTVDLVTVLRSLAQYFIATPVPQAPSSPRNDISSIVEDRKLWKENVIILENQQLSQYSSVIATSSKSEGDNQVNIVEENNYGLDVTEDRKQSRTAHPKKVQQNFMELNSSKIELAKIASSKNVQAHRTIFYQRALASKITRSPYHLKLELLGIGLSSCSSRPL